MHARNKVNLKIIKYDGSFSFLCKASYDTSEETNSKNGLFFLSFPAAGFTSFS